MRVVLATCRPFLTQEGPLAPDDQLLHQTLTRRGIRTESVPWEDHDYDWSRADLVLVRSTWNYYLSYPRYLAWLSTVAAVSTLLNPLPVVQWNTEKRRYLQDLAAAGIPTIPTCWLEKRTSVHLGQFLSTLGWNKAVLKPSIAANCYGTCVVERTQPETVTRGQRHLDHFLGQQDMLLQPYLASVARGGESSHAFINGSWSHAFSRLPFHTLTSAELFAQMPVDEHQVPCPPADEVAVAHTIMQVVEQMLGYGALLYGRVDLVRDGGQLYLMELELTEPLLHLEYGGAGEHLTEAIVTRHARLHHPLPTW